MAVTCWSYMAVRKLISPNRNASNFPRAIILCPQQNKRVIFLKMRGIEIFDKSYGKCYTFDCGNCSFHKHLACLTWGCGRGAGERNLKAKNCCYFSLKSWICFKKTLEVQGFPLSVHIPIKEKRRGCRFEQPANRQEDSKKPQSHRRGRLREWTPVSPMTHSEPVQKWINKLAEVALQAKDFVSPRQRREGAQRPRTN